MVCGAFDFQVFFMGFTPFLRDGNTQVAAQVSAGKGLFAGDQRGDIAIDNDFSAPRAGAGAEVNDMVGFPNRFFIVFHNDDGISHVAQVLEGVDELLVVARMQADGRFVQDIGDAYQSAADLRGKAHALGFAAGKGGRSAVQGEVVKAYFDKELQTLPNFFEQFLCDQRFVGGQ